jgi:hypothetical protein
MSDNNICSGSPKGRPHRKHASPMLNCFVIEGKNNPGNTMTHYSISKINGKKVTKFSINGKLIKGE